MKKVLLSSVALVLLGVNAHAADLPRKAPLMMQPVAVLNTWTGFYVGGHIGAGWQDNDTFGTSSSDSDVRFIGGGQVGFDYQFWNNWVIGFEANYSFVDRDDTATFAGGFAFNHQTRGLFSATGRIGYAMGPTLVYAKGGYAHRDTRDNFTGLGGAVVFTSNDSRDGYTIGGGIEYMFMPSWSAKIEYQYYEFDRTTFTAPAILVASGGFRDEEHTIKFGINYRFNPFNPRAMR